MCEVFTDHSDLRWGYMAVVSVLISIAMIVLDAAMLNAVLPLIASEFQIEASQVFGLVMGYQFLMLVPLLFFGSLANAIGARSVFIVGLLLFVVGAFFGISSADLQGLSFARAVQGLGASAVTSVNMALLRFAYSDVHMPKLMGVSAVVVAFSFIVAPLLSVQLFSVAKWGGVLAVGLVLGGFALIAVLTGVPRIVCELRCVGARELCWPSLWVGFMASGVITLIHVESGGEMFGLTAVGVVLGVYYFASCADSAKAVWSEIMGQRVTRFGFLVVSIMVYFAQSLSLVALPFLIFSKGNGFSGVLWLPSLWAGFAGFSAMMAGFAIKEKNRCAIKLMVFGSGLLALGLGLIGFQTLPSLLGLTFALSICGVGFGLFQLTHVIVLMRAASRRHSNTLSAVIGVARLTGQFVGVSYASLLFSADQMFAGLYSFKLASATVLSASLLALLFSMRK